VGGREEKEGDDFRRGILPPAQGKRFPSVAGPVPGRERRALEKRREEGGGGISRLSGRFPENNMGNPESWEVPDTVRGSGVLGSGTINRQKGRK